MKHILRRSLLYTVYMAVLATSLQAQCTDAQSRWLRPWESCVEKPNPANEVESTHWILYDLGQTYTIEHIKIFNDNLNLSRGFKETMISFSNDRQEWFTAWEGVLEMASGEEDYEGIIVDDMTHQSARYILLSTLQNHGHISCAGLSEVVITAKPIDMTTQADVQALADEIHMFPNPTPGHFTITGQMSRYSVQIIDASGQVHQDLSEEVSPISIDLGHLPAGSYLVRVKNHQNESLWVEVLLKQ